MTPEGKSRIYGRDQRPKGIQAMAEKNACLTRSCLYEGFFFPVSALESRPAPIGSFSGRKSRSLD